MSQQPPSHDQTSIFAAVGLALRDLRTQLEAHIADLHNHQTEKRRDLDAAHKALFSRVTALDDELTGHLRAYAVHRQTLEEIDLEANASLGDTNRLLEETGVNLAQATARIDDTETGIRILQSSIDELGTSADAQAQAMEATEFGLRVHAEDLSKRIDELAEDMRVARDAAEVSDVERIGRIDTRLDDIGEDLLERFATLAAALRESIGADIAATLDLKAETFQGPPGADGAPGHVTRVTAWLPDNPVEALTCVKHRGGLWQAIEANKSEPSTDNPDWTLVARGLSGIDVRQTGPYDIELVVRTSDAEQTFPVALARINYLKTWQKGGTYSLNDSVLWNGQRMLCTVERTTEEPGASSHWIVLAMRGQRGGRGEPGGKGERGPAGPMPPIERVIGAWQDYQSQDGGIPVNRYLGLWSYQSTYRRGDLVVYSGALYIADAEDQGETPPDSPANSAWVLLYRAPTPPALSGGATWGGAYTDGAAYRRNQMVRDGNWLMIANTDTNERPAPQPVGDAYHVYDGASPTGQISAKELIVGQRYSFPTGVFITGYRVYEVVGNEYRVFLAMDPDGANEITEVFSFTGANVGWREFTRVLTPVTAGTTFELAVACIEPDPTPAIWSGNWDYDTPNNPAIPPAGTIIHANSELSTLRVATTDNDGGDRGAELRGMEKGDIIEGPGGIRWSIQTIADNGTWIGFAVAPSQQTTPDGVYTFNFETVTATPITTVVDTDHFAGEPNIDGRYVIDGGDTVVTQDAYGIDIQIQQAAVSPDWDLMMYGG